MKKNFILAAFCLIISAMAFAQVPQKMSYQAVVRGSDNNLVTNSEVSVRISILQGSVDGEAVYTETHSATTNANGLLTIEIGNGTSSDDFSAISWANGPFFVKTETDVNGGNEYDIIGVNQLLSVPYAMYAQTAGNVPDVSGFLTEEIDPTVSEWAKAETKPAYDYSEINNTPEIPTVPTNVSAFENDANCLTSETDPSVPAWAKAESKPVYNYSEIEGTPEIPTIPTNVSAFDNDANYLQSESQTLADAAALGNSVNAQLKNVTDPTEDQDAATKKYIDDIIAPILAQNAELQARIEEIEHFNYMVSLTAHEYVDLGLPSGTKWATCNIGATSPEDYGDYFAWGETTTKDTYSWATYILCNGTSSTLTKYCNNSSYGNNGYTDALSTLEASDDAATANWGSAWRMPTKEEFEELKNNCIVTWTTQSGVNGRLFTGPNGNSIFLPAAGYRNDSSLSGAGSDGFYWSSSLNTDYPYYAWYLYFYSDNYDMDYYYRYRGRSVRAVCQSQN